MIGSMDVDLTPKIPAAMSHPTPKPAEKETSPPNPLTNMWGTFHNNEWYEICYTIADKILGH